MEGLGLKDRLIIRKKDVSGAIVEISEDDLITNAGKQAVVEMLGGETYTFKYIGLGTGTLEPSATDTTLVAEFTRVEGAVAIVTTSIANDTHQVTASFTFTTSYSIGEVGLFDSSTNGTMIARTTRAISVTSGDEIDVVYRIQVA